MSTCCVRVPVLVIEAPKLLQASVIRFNQYYEKQLMSTQNGTVKFFNHEKGFGFITPDNGGKDVFVHKNSIKSGRLTDGCKVSFQTENSPKGLNAINVEVVE